MGKNRDVVLRNLDCAVIETLHEFMRDKKKPGFDSVRGVFLRERNFTPTPDLKKKIISKSASEIPIA